MHKAWPVMKVLLIAIVGAVLFDLLSMPIPWLLGPIFTVLISQFFQKGDLAWPPIFRNTGLVIVGVAIGQAFDLSLFKEMGKPLVFMIVLNVALLIFAVVLAWLATKTTDISMKTALTCSVPGGLSQLILFAEEEKDIDLAVVTFFHVIRVVAVVLVIPFIVSGHVVTGGDNTGTITPTLIIILLLAGCSVWLGQKMKLPVAHFLTPIIFIIVLQLFGVDTPAFPGSLLHIAQLFIGAYIGLLLKPHMIRLPGRVLAMGIFSSLALIVAAFGSSLVLQWMLGYSFATSFLSSAPGGLDQMGLLAAAVGADVSIVTVFQLFRLLFIYLFVLPLLNYVCRKIDSFG